MSSENNAFICPDCKKPYSVAEADRVGSFCVSDSCIDQMVLLERIEGVEEIESRNEIGLGILVCDISGSMEDFAFPDRRVTRLSLIAGNVARGIWDLVDQMVESAQKNAYVALVYFAKEAEMAKDDDGMPFIKSVFEIGETYDSARDFASFITDSMRDAQRNIPQGFVKEVVFGKDNVKHYTSLTAGLELGYKINQAALDGDLSEFGGPENVNVIEDVCITPDGKSALVPNIRCLIYSDGAHNFPKGSDVVNPFDQENGVSVLLTTYFGSDSDKGYEQMKGIAAKCPKHGDKSLFLIDDVEGYQRLRGLFRMSSGVSGFCPSCMPRDF